ncbi:MAG: sugar transferase [Lachnospiraceae bacterium]|nr:sugar transferase [Lachnospiraceae bacterium]
MHERKKKTWTKHFDFMFLDLLFIEVSFILSYIFRFGLGRVKDVIGSSSFFQPYRRIMLLILMLHLVIAFFTDQYSNILKRNSAEEIKRVVQYCVNMLVGVVLVLFMRQTSDTYSRIVVFVFPVIGVFVLFVYRYFYKIYLRKEINKAQNQNCMLLVAPYHKVSAVLREFNNRQISTSRIIGIVLTDNMAELEAAAAQVIPIDAEIADGDSDKLAFDNENVVFDGGFSNSIHGVPVVGNLETMYDYAGSNVVDEVLLYMDGEAADEAVRTFISMGIVVHVSIRNLVQVPNATINRINGIPVVTSSVNNVSTRQLMIKRLVDIFFGLVGSIVTVLLTIIIAPMIMIADPGPIFFRQERVGKNGRTFKIWKFRTMYKDAEARKAELMSQNKMSGLMFKMDDDPRIIGYGKKFSLGKFLRESSLDEMPQSFNILAGSMSVVGTRPPTVQEYQQYELRHKGRLAMMPGLTGMWQVSGRSDITDFEEVVQLDKEYIENFSLALDLEIILKTFKVVLGREGSV